MPSAPIGITPPAPGLEREEPELRREDDIPSDDDGGPVARRGHEDRVSTPGAGDRESRHKPERE